MLEGITINIIPVGWYAQPEIALEGITISMSNQPTNRTKIKILDKISPATLKGIKSVKVKGLDGDKNILPASGGDALLTGVKVNADKSVEATFSPAITYVTDGATEVESVVTYSSNDGTDTDITVRTVPEL